VGVWGRGRPGQEAAWQAGALHCDQAMICGSGREGIPPAGHSGSGETGGQAHWWTVTHITHNYLRGTGGCPLAGALT